MYHPVWVWIHPNGHITRDDDVARWSSGQDGGLSRRKQEFDSPTGHQRHILFLRKQWVGLRPPDVSSRVNQFPLDTSLRLDTPSGLRRGLDAKGEISLDKPGNLIYNIQCFLEKGGKERISRMFFAYFLFQKKVSWCR